MSQHRRVNIYLSKFLNSVNGRIDRSHVHIHGTPHIENYKFQPKCVALSLIIKKGKAIVAIVFFQDNSFR